MLILIPFISLILLFLHFYGGGIPLRRGDESWHEAFLIAVVIWGVLVTLFIETLSLIDAITRIWLVLVWFMSVLLIGLIGARRKTFDVGWRKVKGGLNTFKKHEIWLYGGLAVIVIILLAVALSTPPNNPDSFRYHMSRVTHWAQNQSLDHYPTSRIAQLIRPYWSGITILTLRMLWGSDYPANLVQWLSMTVSLIAVAGVTQLLGGDRKTRIIAAAFVISIPMGILQATTTQNDYAASLWVIVLGYFVVLSNRRVMSFFEWGCTGAALGLGMLSKGTFYAFAFPLLLMLFLPLLRQKQIAKVVGRGALVAIVAVLLNTGLWNRNIQTYGGLFGAPGSGTQSLFITQPLDGSDGLNEIGTGGETGEIQDDNDVNEASDEIQPKSDRALRGYGEKALLFLQKLAIRVARLLAQNIVVPIPGAQKVIAGALYKFPGIFNPDYVEDFSTVLWNHEDTAGNPLHLTIILGVLIFLPFVLKDETRIIGLAYSGAALLGYFMLTLINYGPDIYGVRYQLAFFILMGPVIGIFFRRLLNVELQSVFVIGLLLYSSPYILLNNTRPVIGWQPWVTRVGSVFVEEDINLLFAMDQGVQDEYLAIRDRIAGAGCQKIGLNIGKSDYEYLFWWIFDAPQSGVEIRHIKTRPELERYLDSSFEPCAIICTVCEEEEELLDLPLDVEYGPIKLFRSLSMD